MRYTNKNNLPEPVVKALTHYDKEQRIQGVRVTTLIDSPRISQLKKKHASQIVEDVSNLVWRVMGTAIHEVFERSASNAYVSEERLEHEVDGTLVSGAIDYQFQDEGEIDLKDYKSTSTYSLTMTDGNGKPDWEKQLNVYAYLIRHAKGLKVRNASVIALLRDWSKAQSERRGDYPQASIIEVPITLWPDEEQDAYVKERVRLHRAAEITGDFDDLPECTAEEQWKREGSWAVYKGKNKRALKLFDSEEEAQEFAGQSSERNVVERPATFKRCEDNYCSVADFCDQWKQER